MKILLLNSINAYRIIIFCLLCTYSTSSLAINPFLPSTAFIPDGEPHVFEYKGEQRIFIYGSRDERITGYCGYGHDLWSAPVNDLTRWTNHGEIFNVKQVKDIGYGIVDEQHLGAPDCVYNPRTKKYYLYTFLGASYKMDGIQGPLPSALNYVLGYEDNGPKCVMAESETPVGPFINPVMCNWPPANKAGTFDPSVLVESQSDGSLKVYAYWGMKKGDRWAEIDPKDMHTVINSETKKPDINAWHKTLDPDRLKNTSVFEASSIKKVSDEKYVYIYSSNERRSALTYCYGNSPEGPWKYGGHIICSDINWKKGNNHGSIVKVLDQWYVVYHKPTSDSKNRQAMMEPIEIIIKDDKVIIPEVEMTSQGVETTGLDAFQRYNAHIACYQTNDAYIAGNLRNADGLNPIYGIKGDETILGFKHFNFGKVAVNNLDKLKLKLNCQIINPSRITVWVALPNDSLLEKRIDIANITLSQNDVSDKYQEITLSILDIDLNEKLNQIGGLKGQLSVYLSFEGEKGKELCRLKELEFVKDNASTPNPLHTISTEEVLNGHIETIPTKSRIIESVKINVYPEKGYQLNSIVAIDKNNKTIKLQANPLTPYAPMNYNFFMPNTEVRIQATFEKRKD